MTRIEFITAVYEIAFGDGAILKGFTYEEVVAKLRELLVDNYDPNANMGDEYRRIWRK